MKISLENFSAAQKSALISLLEKAQLLSEPHSRFLSDAALVMVAEEVGQAFREFKSAANNAGF
jgi:hypothetical protein